MDNDTMATEVPAEGDLIKPIHKDTVHRICSGQVVLSLAIAVKELVENSIDAGATIIDIHLKEYGSEFLEVQDNGSGVSEENFEALTLKHYTSKIQEFEDLTALGTLGFRGEALSSLCALCNLVIITKHHSAQRATKITYDCNGRIVERVPTAREQGTTVKLENLFSTLPVRRKEFMKNLKREFNKMCQLLYAYCLVSKGIKFTCTNVTNSGSRSTIVATDGKQTRENIINVFGAKQISSLINVDLVKPEDPILTEYSLKPVEGDLPFGFEFLVSSVIHGSGRSSTDRQFYFFNNRPCEPTKLMKLVNEIYRQYNSNQYPFVYMNVQIKSLMIDVNVTPDKRQIFLENEKLLLATVKASLIESFKAFPSSYKIQNLELSQSCSQVVHRVTPNKGIKRSKTECGFKKGSILETFKKRSKTESAIQSKSFDFSQFVNSKQTISEPNLDESEEIDTDVIDEVDKKLDTLIELACKLTSNNSNEEVLVDVNDIKQDIINTVDKIEVGLDTVSKSRHKRKTVIMNVSLDEIRKVLQDTEQSNLENSIKVKFRSEINPESNKSAEEELRKQFSKEDFKNMEIIGQFNLGFIIAKLKSDLFIIDQHATDEKYNFEQLQQNTIIDSQVLVNPKPLELTAGNECLLIDNLEIFKKNGFSFKIDDTAPCTKKVALTSIPVSRSFVFGKEDIDEMLFMLQESGGMMCRPSRVRGMFALRACRKSIMIGKALSLSDMRRLVDHMGEIEQPWNCPHGRPTMRHLINLDLIQKED